MWATCVPRRPSTGRLEGRMRAVAASAWRRLSGGSGGSNSGEAAAQASPATAEASTRTRERTWPWPADWRGEAFLGGELEPTRYGFSCVGKSCAEHGQTHERGTIARTYWDQRYRGDDVGFQRMCQGCVASGAELWTPPPSAAAAIAEAATDDEYYEGDDFDVSAAITALVDDAHEAYEIATDGTRVVEAAPQTRCACSAPPATHCGRSSPPRRHPRHVRGALAPSASPPSRRLSPRSHMQSLTLCRHAVFSLCCSALLPPRPPPTRYLTHGSKTEVGEAKGVLGKALWDDIAGVVPRVQRDGSLELSSHASRAQSTAGSAQVARAFEAAFPHAPLYHPPRAEQRARACKRGVQWSGAEREAAMLCFTTEAAGIVPILFCPEVRPRPSPPLPSHAPLLSPPLPPLGGIRARKDASSITYPRWTPRAHSLPTPTRLLSACAAF